MRRNWHKTAKGQLSLWDDIAFCKACCRVLVHPDSVERRYGPVCWAKVEERRVKREQLKTTE